MENETAIVSLQKDMEYVKRDVSETRGKVDNIKETLDGFAVRWQEVGGMIKMIEEANSHFNDVRKDFDEHKKEQELEMDSIKQKIWIAYGGVLVMAVLVVPIFINVISSYFSKR